MADAKKTRHISAGRHHDDISSKAKSTPPTGARKAADTPAAEPIVTCKRRKVRMEDDTYTAIASSSTQSLSTSAESFLGVKSRNEVANTSNYPSSTEVDKNGVPCPYTAAVIEWTPFSPLNLEWRSPTYTYEGFRHETPGILNQPQKPCNPEDLNNHSSSYLKLAEQNDRHQSRNDKFQAQPLLTRSRLSLSFLNSLTQWLLMWYLVEPPWPSNDAMHAPVCTSGPSLPSANPPATLPMLPTTLPTSVRNKRMPAQGAQWRPLLPITNWGSSNLVSEGLFPVALTARLPKSPGSTTNQLNMGVEETRIISANKPGSTRRRPDVHLISEVHDPKNSTDTNVSKFASTHNDEQTLEVVTRISQP